MMLDTYRQSTVIGDSGKDFLQRFALPITIKKDSIEPGRFFPALQSLYVIMYTSLESLIPCENSIKTLKSYFSTEKYGRQVSVSFPYKPNDAKEVFFSAS